MSDFGRYTLADWLEHIQTQHWRSVDMSLERIAQVWARLGAKSDSASDTDSDSGLGLVIAVAGTNGKGSCVAMLESVLRAAGRKTGSYTSPHLVRYNERVRIAGRAVDDATLCAAFAEIERARAQIPLTYFEFGTLCALVIFRQQQVEVSILEVGMGGRLDAVNLIHNDIALITTIGIDHAAWLGSSRAAIATEKAGILKKNGLAVCAEPNPPANIAHTATEQNCVLLQNGVDYQIKPTGEHSHWQSRHPFIPPEWQRVAQLRQPFGGVRQLDNLGGVVAVLALTAKRTGVTRQNLQDGLANTRLMARCQVISGTPEIILDVAHNLDSARDLAAFLGMRKIAGKTHGVLGMLADKPSDNIISVMANFIDRWHLATLSDARGQTAYELERILNQALNRDMTMYMNQDINPDTNPDINQNMKKQSVVTANPTAASLHDSPLAAALFAIDEAAEGDRVVIFGSFYTVGDIIAHFEHDRDWSADILR